MAHLLSNGVDEGLNMSGHVHWENACAYFISEREKDVENYESHLASIIRKFCVP